MRRNTAQPKISYMRPATTHIQSGQRIPWRSMERQGSEVFHVDNEYYDWTALDHIVVSRRISYLYNLPCPSSMI